MFNIYLLSYRSTLILCCVPEKHRGLHVFDTSNIIKHSCSMDRITRY